VKNEALTLEGIKQYYIPIDKDEWKFDVLISLYSNLDINQALIYCNSKKQVEELTKKMLENDFSISAMHSDLD
jgi:superfamily II DNA/RNA helicase